MLILTPDLEIPFIDPNDQDFDKLTLRERAEVAVKTINILGSAGAEFEDDYEDTEKSEITYKTKSDEELDEELEKRIQSILSKNTIDITPEEVFGSARERSPFTKQNSQSQAAQ